MEQAKIQEIAKGFSGIAKSILEKGEEVMPIVAIITHTGDIQVVGINMSKKSKYAAYAKVKEMAEAAKAVALIHVTDTWFYTVPALPGESADTLDTDSMTAPSDHPERREAIMVIAQYITGGSYLIQSEYKRDGGKIVWGEEKILENEELVNRLLPFGMPSPEKVS